MRRGVFGIFVICLYLVFFVVASIHTLAPAPIGARQGHVLAAEAPQAFTTSTGMPDLNRLLTRTNTARSSADIAPLEVNNALTELAQRRADDMANRHYYAHKSPDGLYYYDQLNRTGFKDRYSCENLALASTPDANVFMNQWLTSTAGHKDCLLNPTVNRIGYGVAKLGFDPQASDGDSYIVVAIHANL